MAAIMERPSAIDERPICHAVPDCDGWVEWLWTDPRGRKYPMCNPHKQSHERGQPGFGAYRRIAEPRS